MSAIRRRMMMAAVQPLTPLDYTDGLLYRLNGYTIAKTSDAIDTGITPITNGWYPFTCLGAVFIDEQIASWAKYDQHQIGGVINVRTSPYPRVALAGAGGRVVGNYLLAYMTWLEGGKVRARELIISAAARTDTTREANDAYRTWGKDTSHLMVGRVSDGRYFKGHYYEFAFFARCITDAELRWWIRNYNYLIK